jgi:hypothetical protein
MNLRNRPPFARGAAAALWLIPAGTAHAGATRNFDGPTAGKVAGWSDPVLHYVAVGIEPFKR